MMAGFCRGAPISATAEESGRISVGDVLLSIHGCNAKVLTIGDEETMVIGTPNTQVTLVMIDAEKL